MAPPDNIEKFHEEVVLKVDAALSSGQNVIAHCRGGVGRAGLLACCVCAFREPEVFKTPASVIKYVRSKRDKRCVESRKQEDFVADYFKFLKSIT